MHGDASCRQIRFVVGPRARHHERSARSPICRTCERIIFMSERAHRNAYARAHIDAGYMQTEPPRQKQAGTHLYQSFGDGRAPPAREVSIATGCRQGRSGPSPKFSDEPSHAWDLEPSRCVFLRFERPRVRPILPIPTAPSKWETVHRLDSNIQPSYSHHKHILCSCEMAKVEKNHTERRALFNRATNFVPGRSC